jgi:hypothetical protein
MATSDLCNELQRDVKLDAALEARVCSAILKRLDDTSNDVQSKAITCLGILLGKVQRAQVFEISDKLCSLILEGKVPLYLLFISLLFAKKKIFFFTNILL